MEEKEILDNLHQKYQTDVAEIHYAFHRMKRIPEVMRLVYLSFPYTNKTELTREECVQSCVDLARILITYGKIIKAADKIQKGKKRKRR